MAKVHSEKKERKNRKMIFGFVALFAAIAVIVGVGYAYFSDILTGTGQATAGTLDISGTPSIKQNGTAVAGGTISNLNPGDVISVDTGTITNNGSKSAWIRSVLEFTALSSTPNDASGVGASTKVGDLSQYIWVCTGGESQTTLIAASTAGTLGAGTTASCTQVTSADVTNSTPFGAKATYTAPDDVISGSAEADGASTTWTPTAPVVIYFDAAAPNAAQNGNMAFNILVQALQYKNNTTSPTEAQWDTVTSTSFAL
ncbi:CalY family protein [Candidatus Saccharibacteria bacterium]|nr:CalY family protein [Candidatus Saccharibacteria bacterium]